MARSSTRLRSFTESSWIQSTFTLGGLLGEKLGETLFENSKIQIRILRIRLSFPSSFLLNFELSFVVFRKLNGNFFPVHYFLFCFRITDLWFGNFSDTSRKILDFSSIQISFASKAEGNTKHINSIIIIFQFPLEMKSPSHIHASRFPIDLDRNVRSSALRFFNSSRGPWWWSHNNGKSYSHRD